MSKVIIFSGAGLSADSGLGVFRGSNGLWDNYDINKVCNISTWEENYNLVHEFYSKRRKEYMDAKPNEMHKLIAQLQLEFGEKRVVIITQNIDNLLEAAGAKEVMHLHGHVNYIHCTKCEKEFFLDCDFNDFIKKQEKCDKCGGTHFKPSIVFFGENAPMYALMYLRFSKLEAEDGVVVIGTSGSVVPIGQMVGNKSSGIPAKRLLCNLEPSQYINDSYFDKVIYNRAELSTDEVASFVRDILK